MKRLALLLAPLLLIVGLAVAPSASAAVEWQLCYGQPPGTGCTPHSVASNRVPAWTVAGTGSYRLTFQSDCNLVFYDPGFPGGVSWASNTVTGARPCTLNWQGDGNVVIRNASGAAIWNAGTNQGNYGYVMRATSGGCLTIDRVTTIIWRNHSWCTDS